MMIDSSLNATYLDVNLPNFIGRRHYKRERRDERRRKEKEKKKKDARYCF
jgi:hypothetical protein